MLAGLPSFNAAQCSGGGLNVTLDPETPNSAAFKERTKKGETKEAEELFKRLKQYAFGEQYGTQLRPGPWLHPAGAAGGDQR